MELGVGEAETMRVKVTIKRSQGTRWLGQERVNGANCNSIAGCSSILPSIIYNLQWTISTFWWQ